MACLQPRESPAGVPQREVGEPAVKGVLGSLRGQEVRVGWFGGELGSRLGVTAFGERATALAPCGRQEKREQAGGGVGAEGGDACHSMESVAGVTSCGASPIL